MALVSGARRLPHDMLSEIFMASLPLTQYASMKSLDSPLLLSHICRAWRNLALSMPRLWASLRIDTPRTSTSERVTSWLARSGNLPLSISSSSTTTPMLKSLLEYAPRWEHIRFEKVSAQSVTAFAQLSPDDVPLLKTAVIEDEEVYETALSFISAPHIRRLSLRSSSWGLQYRTSPLFLSHLSLRRVPSTHALRVLQLCPALETCTLQTYNPVLATDARNAIRLERMQRFCLIDPPGKAPLLHCIVLPNLQSLEYSNPKKTPDDLEALLLSLCNPGMLTDLRLSTEISTDQLARVLRHFRMLQKICLHRPRESLSTGLTQCSLFALLTPPPTSSLDVLCPRLETICSLGVNVGSDKELLNLIEMRYSMDGVQPLSHVHVAFARARQLNILPLLPDHDLVIDLQYKGYLPAVQYFPVAQKVAPQLQIWRQDPDVDWAAISGEWLAEYDDWGGEEEVCRIVREYEWEEESEEYSDGEEEYIRECRREYRREKRRERGESDDGDYDDY
ncbi:hypothetical protein DFH06DRAFT_1427171 [Mycena polygramma]|nr:hypothetical protein DFH06DRAFT_1427171 [Mycena polygramma]